jgi:hypothetical protein
VHPAPAVGVDALDLLETVMYSNPSIEATALRFETPSRAGTNAGTTRLHPTPTGPGFLSRPATVPNPSPNLSAATSSQRRSARPTGDSSTPMATSCSASAPCRTSSLRGLTP